MKQDKILDKINILIEKYVNTENKTFIPGKTRIQFAGPVYGSEEIQASLKSLLSGWFTSGKNVLEFEKKFAKEMGAKYCESVNSGSSALLLAFNSLKNKRLENPLKDGDEIITGAVTHPATINSILLNNLKPVLVDVTIPEYNLDVNLIEKAITKKTRGILPMHFLGNPCNMDKIMKIAKKYNLYVIEDACDAYGSLYNNRKVGSFGDLGTMSFYTAHVITLFEGGAITFNNVKYQHILRSLKAWGRLCTCDRCEINFGEKCPIRFEVADKKFKDYDRRYMFDNVGYNLKLVEVQAAFGLEQLKRLKGFIKKRNDNFNFIVNHLKRYEDYLILPKATEKSKPVWFAVPLSIKKNSEFKRKDLIEWLEKHNIETRPFFAGFIPEQPAYRDKNIKVVGDCKNTRFTKDNSFFIGCYPGIDKEMLKYVVSVFDKFFDNLE